MISRRLKLKPNRATEAELQRVLWQYAGLYNWAALKLFRDGLGGRFYSRWDFQTLIKGHGEKCGLHQQTMDGIVTRAYRAHHARSNRGRPARLKSRRNRLNSISLRQGVRWSDRTHIKLPGLGKIKVSADPRFPAGAIRCAVLQKLPRGWYVTVVIEAEPKSIPAFPADAPEVGVDFGFATLATLSTGEKIEHPREYAALEARLGQADRAHNRRLLGRLHQRLTNARRVRNHAISRDLLSRHAALYLSRDNYRGLQRVHGKSVQSAGIYQLITMMHAKSRPGGCRVVEVSNVNSTRTCSACGALTGPAGRHGLRVRAWSCGACGASHCRDQNAAVNTLRLGAVLAHEIGRES